MKRRGRIALFAKGAGTAMLGLMLIALASSSAAAKSAKPQHPPHEGCVSVTKGEYDGAKRQRLLRSRYGSYVRTGRVWQRHYWYCR